MRILRAADHKRMPWKNGGGETVEIAFFPEGAGLSQVDWRVSMARVDDDGPFSNFPGIDRTLSILEGAGIVLHVEGRASRRLVIESEPHPFPADVATSAGLIAGPVVDFNVMSRRGKVEHEVRRHQGRTSAPSGLVRLAFCTRGTVAVSAAASSETLGRYDAALFPENEAAELVPDDGSEFYLVEFRPV